MGLPWVAIASHRLQRHVPRVAIGHGAATARVIVVPMTRAVALAVTDHDSTMARTMATLMVCSAMAANSKPKNCRGLQWNSILFHINSRMAWHCRGLAWARAWHCYAMSHPKMSNGFSVAHGSVRAVHCCTILVGAHWISNF